jgi:hypothetical protein
MPEKMLCSSRSDRNKNYSRTEQNLLKLVPMEPKSGSSCQDDISSLGKISATLESTTATMLG